MDCQENVRIASSYPYNCQVKLFYMNDEDRQYLESTEKMRPSFGIFERMVQILTNTQEEINQLLNIANAYLLETSKTIIA